MADSYKSRQRMSALRRTLMYIVKITVSRRSKWVRMCNNKNMPFLSTHNRDNRLTEKILVFLLERIQEEGLEIQLELIPVKSGEITIQAVVGVYGSDGVIFLKVGDILFLDSRFMMLLERIAGLPPNIIFLDEFWAFLNNPDNLLYSVTVIAAIRGLNLKGKIVLDLGCAEGVLGLIALSMGAKEVLGVDNNQKAFSRFQQNLELNKIDPLKAVFLNANFRDKQRVLDSVSKNTEVVFANIGPHFGESDIEALSLIEHLPEVKVVVGAGYHLDGRDFHPSKALDKLERMQFKKDKRFVKSEGNHIAFIVNR